MTADTLDRWFAVPSYEACRVWGTVSVSENTVAVFVSGSTTTRSHSVPSSRKMTKPSIALGGVAMIVALIWIKAPLTAGFGDVAIAVVVGAAVISSWISGDVLGASVPLPE